MLNIKKAEKTEVEDIANIHYTSWNAAYADLIPAAYISQNNNLAENIAMWQKIIVHPDVSVWLAYDSNSEKQSSEKQHSVGFIGYFNKGNNYEITTLYVLPEYQDSGIGTQLMQVALQEISKSEDNSKLSLWVLENNIAAIRFYESQGL